MFWGRMHECQSPKLHLVSIPLAIRLSNRTFSFTIFINVFVKFNLHKAFKSDSSFAVTMNFISCINAQIKRALCFTSYLSCFPNIDYLSSQIICSYD